MESESIGADPGVPGAVLAVVEDLAAESLISVVTSVLAAADKLALGQQLLQTVGLCLLLFLFIVQFALEGGLVPDAGRATTLVHLLGRRPLGGGGSVGERLVLRHAGGGLGAASRGRAQIVEVVLGRRPEVLRRGEHRGGRVRRRPEARGDALRGWLRAHLLRALVRAHRGGRRAELHRAAVVLLAERRQGAAAHQKPRHEWLHSKTQICNRD